MIAKVIGSIMVIFSTALIGFNYASALEKRKRSLMDFQTALTMLESEISFAANPLATAFLAISKNIPSPVGSFFYDIAQLIEKHSLNIQKTWNNTLQKYVKALCLTQADVEIILTFAAQMGKTDIENQLKNIRHTIDQLKMQTALAAQTCDKNKKLYQSFGVLLGILIAILLF